MAPGKRESPRRRPEASGTGRGPRKGERKTEQSHVKTQFGCEVLVAPHNQVVTYPLQRKGRTMVAVKEITWEEASAPGFETTTRRAWREAVAEIAERAKQTLPECNGRVDKAVAIVLNGDVELLADGKRRVRLERWLEQDLEAWFSGRVLLVDRQVAARWASLLAQGARRIIVGSALVKNDRINIAAAREFAETIGVNRSCTSTTDPSPRRKNASVGPIGMLLRKASSNAA